LRIAATQCVIAGAHASREVESEVDSTRGLLRLWLLLAVVLLGYSYIDLRLNPWLETETHFSLRPDFTQLHDLWHWGGRLLRHGAVSLLVANAVVMAGIAALAIHSIALFVQRRRTSSGEARVSVVPGAPPTSVPPPST
jgi:hypothetical protein